MSSNREIQGPNSQPTSNLFCAKKEQSNKKFPIRPVGATLITDYLLSTAALIFQNRNRPEILEGGRSLISQHMSSVPESLRIRLVLMN